MNARIDFIEGFSIAVRSLRAHRLRTVLTIVGVGIGVATLLAILGITQGLDSSFEKQLSSLGTNSLYVSKWPWVQTGGWWEYRNRKSITLQQVNAVRTLCTQCAAVAPSISEDEDITFADRTMPAVQIVGTTSEWMSIQNYEIRDGRFISAVDDDNRRAVAVIGNDVAATLFPLSSPIGATLRIGDKPFTIVGTLVPKGKLLDSSLDLNVFIPFSTFRGYFQGRRSVDIGVSVHKPEDLAVVEDQLVGILRRVRQTPPEKPDDFSINKADQLADTYNKLTGALYGVAVGIGFITLLVGGIGIMNIMLVSVRERTREIGIRRALGARKRTIIIQFVLEAMVVSAVGGAIGTLVGLGGAKIVSLITPLAATVKPLTIFFGVFFAAVVGLVFGLWPAARAANLDPVEALRQE